MSFSLGAQTTNRAAFAFLWTPNAGFFFFFSVPSASSAAGEGGTIPRKLQPIPQEGELCTLLFLLLQLPFVILAIVSLPVNPYPLLFLGSEPLLCGGFFLVRIEKENVHEIVHPDSVA